MRAVVNILCAGVFAAVAAAGIAFAAGGGGDGNDGGAVTAPHKAEVLIQNEQYEEAVHLLEGTAASADAHNWLGYAYRHLGEYDKSQQHYEEALKLDAGHRGALEYYGELHLLLGNPAAAEELLVRLDEACFFGCEEYDELKEAIERYSAPQPQESQ